MSNFRRGVFAVVVFFSFSMARAESANLSASHEPKLDPKIVEYYRDLIKRHRAKEVLHLEEFNRTFGPTPRTITESEDRILGCQAGWYSESTECNPDTFYSWGPDSKLMNVSAHSPNLQTWKQPFNGRRQLYLSHSSIATYCFGRHPVRLKLRKGRRAPAASGYRGWKRGNALLMEWIIPVGEESLVESVSYGQPEHFDEMLAEIRFRISSVSWANAFLYDARLEDMDTSNPQARLERLLQGCVSDILPLTEEVLVENLITLVETVIANRGWIHTQKCEGCDVKNHFRTSWPTFFNPE